MILSAILKNLKFIIDAAIIVGILLVFAYWDPFGLFGTKVKTDSTANLVSNVREMGELITAEYYGEVVASWKEGKISRYSADTVQELVLQQYKDLKYALWEIYKISKDAHRENRLRVKRRKIDDLLISVNPSFVKSMVYYDLLVYLGANRYGIEEEEEFRLLWPLYNDVVANVKNRNDLSETADYLNATDGLAATDVYEAFKNAIAEDLFDSRSTRRKNIVFIGRGWVKAGFDFGNLNENNFFYDSDNATVTFLGLEPKILNADINPWFIPENRVKGFELVDYDGKVNFQDAILVKKKCKQKLRDQALGAGILESASENGKTALANFFSLVLGKEVKYVSFLANRYDYLYTEVGKDSLVSLEEALVIEKVYREEWAVIRQENVPELREKKLENLRDFLAALQQLDYLEKGKNYNFNYFSLLCSRILGSNTGFTRMEKAEMDSLYRLRLELAATPGLALPDIIQEDSLWFDSGTAYLAGFNDALRLLTLETDEYDSLITGEYSLGDLCFACPGYPGLAGKDDFAAKCKGDSALRHPELLALRKKDCERIVNKLLADRQKHMKEREKMWGIPYQLGMWREKIKNHFNKGN